MANSRFLTVTRRFVGSFRLNSSPREAEPSPSANKQKLDTHTYGRFVRFDYEENFEISTRQANVEGEY
ncbi:hypothetical protein ACFSBF_04975 [Sphingobacterium suaedae]